ncbi:MAG TPA: DUF3604 domain-containing protein [Deltaproteobacteria bacterium]|nr:DUF3604 domain-containing protein [Deltaproteobacteria bacterium]
MQIRSSDHNPNGTAPLAGLLFVLLLLPVWPAQAADQADYSPPVAHDYPRQVFFGDTHLHTNLSPDAFTFGNRTLSPEKAFRFARGETVTSQSGVKARLARPLDFLLVSDHAEFLGIFPRVFADSPDIAETKLGRRWRNYIDTDRTELILMEFGLMSMGAIEDPDKEKYLIGGVTPEMIDELKGMNVPPDLERSIWEKVGEVADRFNDPGQFTAFIGYEWTSMPGGNNLHRNVLFRDGSDKTSQVVPFSSMDSGDPEDLWRYLAAYEEKTGGRVMAIPHNGNVSNGLMFAETTLDGAPIDKDYAERRMRWERVVEVTQIKGDGETHPFLSPNDEFADYETWDRANLSFNTPKKKSMLTFEYARSALRRGLAMEQRLGANPYQFGMIGSTDSHTGLATADEDNFFGKMSSAEPAPGRARKSFFPGELGVELRQWATAASGYAAVWARENTRESLFDAISRRETYATTGPRITVRFFGGWNFEPEDLERPDFAGHAYREGVPMGGELPQPKGRQSPRFIVSALKDPLGANLDRIQIIKGWVDEAGETHEKVYNVAASDNRKIKHNRVRPVGNTVNVAEATYRNSIGDPILGVVWKDPDFDPDQRAFYYVRVLEIPTPRWTTYDARFFGEERVKEVPAWTQERAYTSPIWFTPERRE